ncbi:MAG: MFS transporter [bacterium]|nr:MFS transporter [bacterium]
MSSGPAGGIWGQLDSPSPAELNRPESDRAVTAAIVLAVAATAVFGVQPLFVGAVADELSLSDRQIGFLAGGDLAGIALASLLAPLWLARVRWRPAAAVAMVVLVAGNLASALAGSYASLIALRFALGLAGSGLALTLAIAALHQSRAMARHWAIFVAGNTLAGALGLWGLPYLIPAWGFRPVVLALAACALAALPFARWLPAGGDEAPEPESRSHAAAEAGSRVPVVMALLAHGLFYVGGGAVWAFIERIGDAGGLGATAIGGTLARAMPISVFGAGLAAWAGTRFGYTRPLVLAGIVFTTAMALLAGPLTVATFGAAACLMFVAWNAVAPYQMGLISEHDPAGRSIVLAPVVKAAGITLGPVIAGLVLDGSSYLPVVWIGVLFAGLGISLSFVVALKTRAGGADNPDGGRGRPVER